MKKEELKHAKEVKAYSKMVASYYAFMRSLTRKDRQKYNREFSSVIDYYKNH